MKIIQKITALAFLLGATSLVNAQTTDTAPNSMERVGMADNNDDNGKWGLAGLLGLLGLLGMRRTREDHHQGRGSNTH